MALPDTVIQLTLLTTVHVHALVVVTVALPGPPPLVTVNEVGVTEKLQAPPCDTVKVRPAIVNVPVRPVVAVLAATLKFTVPLPDPLAPDVTVIQVALLTAVHPQPVPAVTFVLPVPPAATAFIELEDRAKLHTAVNENVFESALGVLPPGPTAATSETYVVPMTGHPTRIDVRSTVMVLVPSGVGLPSELV